MLASFISWFLIANTWYFPYITGKQIYFNIVVELLLVFYAAMLAKFPETRPKRNWISIGCVLFLLALLASSIFGVDWNLSFWGDAERMLGLFELAHFFALYFLIISVFTSKKDWYLLFNGAIAAALGLAIYAFAKYNGAQSSGNVNLTSNISTLGNATYVAGVMLFAFWFVVYMLIKTKDWLIRSLYLVALAIIFACFMFADVSGSQAGFAASAVAFAFIWGFWNKSKKAKRLTLGILGIFLAFVVVMFAVRDNHALDNSRLGKVFRDFSTSNPMLNTRFYAWSAAVKGFRDMPVLGSGYGNYALFFDKYFQGGYYKYTMTEEYFDHAHNNILDIASTSGVVGLLTYFMIFIAVAYYAIRAWRQGRIGLTEFAFITAVFVSYFVHNLAVFDAMANLMLLMIALGYVYWLQSGETAAAMIPAVQYVGVKVKNKAGKVDKHVDNEHWQFQKQELIAFAVAACFCGFLILHYNVKIAKAFQGSIDATQTWREGNLQLVLENWQKALSYHTPLDRDLRSLLASQVISNYQQLQANPGKDRDAILEFAAQSARQNVALNPKDSMMNLWLAQVLYYKGMMQKDIAGVKESLYYADQTVINGGEHIPPAIFKSSIQSSLSDPNGALATLRQALTWYPEYYDIYCYIGDITIGTKKEYTPANLIELAKCMDYSTKSKLIPDKTWAIAAEKYAQAKDYAHVAKALAIRLANTPNDQTLRNQAISNYLKADMKDAASQLIEEGKNLEQKKLQPQSAK